MKTNPSLEMDNQVTQDDAQQAIAEIKAFAKHWNELYAAHRFEDMMQLATEDVGIANSAESTCPTGLIYGRDAYFKGIHDAYHGNGNEHNLLVMQYEGWEYVPLGLNFFYTIGRYTLQPNTVGVNCWMLRRIAPGAPWRIFRVINTQ